MKKLLSNLNPRLMVIHLIAFWFFAYAFFTLAFLHDFAFLHLGSERMIYGIDKPRFIYDREFIQQAGNFGLLAAYIVSWAISTRRGWHWINSLSVFFVAFILYNLGMFGWNVVQGILQAPGSLFPFDSIWGSLTNGLLMLAVGTVVFFWKRLIPDTERVDKTHKQPSSNHKKPIPARR